MIVHSVNNYQKEWCGGKASNLFALHENGFNVPEFVVLPANAMIQYLGVDFIKKSSLEEIKAKIRQCDASIFPVNEIINALGESDWFAVRSSALDEDGKNHSFAGQYDSFLFVSKDNIADAIRKVWLSVFSDHVVLYRTKNNLPSFGPIAVVVQRMIPAESAGVGFGINPMTGNRKQFFINAVFGLGEGLVSGELVADNYLVNDDSIEKEIAEKTHQVVMDTNGGTKTIDLNEKKKSIPVLTDAQIKQVRDLIKKANRFFKHPQDIEFAFHNENLYLLQSRPITTLNKVPDISSKRIVWDNSNIIESYPGVTSPLTFSFILGSYEAAYRLFLEYMGATAVEIEKNKAVFANTLGLIQGRVYYNLRSWYQMLAMVPGYSINAQFMEKMMGVKERFELENHVQLSKGRAWWRTIKMLVKMYTRYRSIPKQRAAFKILLDKTIDEYKAIDFSEKTPSELMQLYIRFERTLLNEWKAPLLNDFFAMIAFGSLQKRCDKYGLNKNNTNIHNDLLCGSADIISVQPIHRSIEIATVVSSDTLLKQWFLSLSDQEVWNALEKGQHNELYKLVKNYINDFGERCVGELKLETISYSQDPPMFIRVIRNYVEANITTQKTRSTIEEDLRVNAEQEVDRQLRGKWYKKYKLKKAVKNARSLVSNRENLRYERTRAFGIVRILFSQIGEKFFSEGIFDDPRDIFYLTKQEIFDFIGGTSVSVQLKAIVDVRKKEYDAYRAMPVPAERIETYGMVYQGNDFYNRNKVEKLEGDLKGIGCCPGRVTAKVSVIMDPKSEKTLNGNILVTSSTDPGWVTLFPTASAILVERGSLLSHSAIVAREMGIPCIVGVTGLLRSLETGDEVEMDGSTGLIRIINKISKKN